VDQLSKVEKLAAELEPGEQVNLYLTIAESGLINGKIGVAHAAAAKAGRFASDDSSERARSRLYEAAALILTKDVEGGLGKLESVDGSRLPKGDAQLKEAVAGIAKAIQKGPDEPKAGPEAGSRGGGRASVSAAALIDRAQGAIDQAEGMLKRTAP
jgi:chemotaxis protein MotC